MRSHLIGDRFEDYEEVNIYIGEIPSSPRKRPVMILHDSVGIDIVDRLTDRSAGGHVLRLELARSSYK